MNKPDQRDRHGANDEPDKPGLWHLIVSVLAGAIGVQSDKNRERDFQKGDFKKFVIGGLVFTVLFIVVLLTIVNWVISS